MDMLETLHYTVTGDNCDTDGYFDICELIHQTAVAATTRNRLEGGSEQRLMEQLHAVWMIRRIKFEQFRHIRLGDELVGYSSSRSVCGRQYAQLGELYFEGRLAARIQLMIMPVQLRGRRRLSCQDTEPLFDVPPRNEAQSFERLPTIDGFPYTAERLFTEADCDANASHLSFYYYPELFRSLTGYWDGERPLISQMQIDYIRECLNGDRIRMGAIPQGQGFKVQALHKNGRPCFNAYCEYKR